MERINNTGATLVQYSLCMKSNDNVYEVQTKSPVEKNTIIKVLAFCFLRIDNCVLRMPDSTSKTISAFCLKYVPGL